MQKPSALKKGDTVAFLAPSSGLAANLPHRLEQAVQFFEERGYKTKIFPTARKDIGFASDTPENRAKDMNEAFSDPQIKAIITTIGGFNSHQILEYLDFDMISKRPKIFCGISDITTLHNALQTQAGMVTFYGPSAIGVFGEAGSPEPYSFDHFFAACTGKVGQVHPSETWTDDKAPNWFNLEHHTMPRKRKANPGYDWLKEGVAQGQIVGGCVTTLMNTRGTKYHTDLEEKVLLLETPEGEPYYVGEAVGNIDAYLGILRMDGTFDKIKGIVLAEDMVIQTNKSRS